MAKNANPRIRTLYIKTGVLKRVARCKVLYDEEFVEQQERVQKYKGEGKDIHDIRKQEEILEEAIMMVDDAKKRLRKAHADMMAYIATCKDLSEILEYKEAQKVIDSVAPIMRELEAELEEAK